MKATKPKATRAKREAKARFELEEFLRSSRRGKTVREYQDGERIFSQGEVCGDVCYLEHGKVKVTVVSDRGKEAVIAIVQKGEFFGEDCMIGRAVHLSTAAAFEAVRVVRFEKKTMIRLLQLEQEFSALFTAHLLARTVRVQEDLLDHFFNNSERRLARILLLLANFDKEAETGRILPRIGQETLASMVGTTRPRINSFMQKFRKLGFIDYNGELEVHSSLGLALGG